MTASGHMPLRARNQAFVLAVLISLAISSGFSEQISAQQREAAEVKEPKDTAAYAPLVNSDQQDEERFQDWFKISVMSLFDRLDTDRMKSIVSMIAQIIQQLRNTIRHELEKVKDTLPTSRSGLLDNRNPDSLPGTDVQPLSVVQLGDGDVEPIKSGEKTSSPLKVLLLENLHTVTDSNLDLLDSLAEQFKWTDENLGSSDGLETVDND